MADRGAEGSGKPALTAAQRQLLRRRQELDSWRRNASRLRSRNLLTGLGIGAFVVAMSVRVIKEELHRIAGFPGVIGCTDGTHIPIIAPSHNEGDHVNMKSIHSINVQCPVSYTILSVKQERIMEELDDEAKINIIRGPRTGANS